MSLKAIDQALSLLEEKGCGFYREGLEQAEAHLALIREWNHAVSLVSHGDLAFLGDRHLVDSLSLAPYIVGRRKAARLLDIGSGAGFPAISLKCVYPDLPVLCIERSVRKVGFLQRVIATLGLEGIEVIAGEFPEYPGKIDAGVLTARAVERPRQVYKKILERLPSGSSFLCQLEGVPAAPGGQFQSLVVSDAWQQGGLRRGKLQVITRM